MSSSGPSRDVALGVSHFGTPPKRQILAGIRPNTIQLDREAIEVFGKRQNAATYRHWRREGVAKTDFAFDFGQAFNEATSNARQIHFNLDGMNLPRAWRQGQYNYLDPRGSYTSWEFRQVLDRPELRDITIFWQNGRLVPLSSVLP